MRLDEGAEIISFARVEKDEELEKELAAEEENIANAPAPTVDEEDMPVEKADAHLDIPEEE